MVPSMMKKVYLSPTTAARMLACSIVRQDLVVVFSVVSSAWGCSFGALSCILGSVARIVRIFLAIAHVLMWQESVESAK